MTKLIQEQALLALLSPQIEEEHIHIRRLPMKLSLNSGQEAWVPLHMLLVAIKQAQVYKARATSAEAKPTIWLEEEATHLIWAEDE